MAGAAPKATRSSRSPAPYPAPVEWTAVTTQNPGHTIYFAPTAGATVYRVYFAATEAQLAGRRPLASFEEAQGSPHVRSSINQLSGVYYRVIAMNGPRIGSGGPVAISPTSVISQHNLPVAGAAFGRVNADDCLDLPTAVGGATGQGCGTYTARVLADVGLADLIASPRVLGDARLADFNGDGFEDLFSNTNSLATVAGSIALLHVNQGNGNFQTSSSVSSLAIGGVGGTLLAADFDNDGDVDLFAPNDQSRGDGARNWLLMNDGAGVFTDVAVAAGVATNPAGAAYVPRGGQAVDFNEDGFIDLLFGSRLLLNNGNGTFSDGSIAANVPVLPDNGLKLIDAELDGDLDLIHHTGIVTRLFRNTGGVFDGGEEIGADPEASFGFGLNACDFNGDGFEDVVVANNRLPIGLGAPKLLVNVEGDLLLSSTQPGNPVSRNDQVACADQNNDGMVDILSRWGTTYRLMRTAQSLSRRIRLRIVGGDGDFNQQGRIVRVVPAIAPSRIMTRVVDSGSGLRSQNMYDLLIGAPWTGDYEVTVQFAAGDVTTTAESGDRADHLRGRPRRGHRPRRGIDAQPSAASRSATRSPTSSIPIESRTSESLMPSFARASGGTEAWVMIAG